MCSSLDGARSELIMRLESVGILLGSITDRSFAGTLCRRGRQRCVCSSPGQPATSDREYNLRSSGAQFIVGTVVGGQCYARERTSVKCQATLLLLAVSTDVPVARIR